MTPHEFSSPKEMLNLSSCSNDTYVLPRHAKNLAAYEEKLRNEPKKMWEFCHLEITFDIEAHLWKYLFRNGKLNNKFYPYYIRNRIKKYVNNVCNVMIKYVKFSKKRNAFTIVGHCKHNSYKSFKICGLLS